MRSTFKTVALILIVVAIALMGTSCSQGKDTSKESGETAPRTEQAKPEETAAPASEAMSSEPATGDDTMASQEESGESEEAQEESGESEEDIK